MGYRFSKKGAGDLYIRLCDAQVVRACARIEALDELMPQTEAMGGEIPKEHHALLAATLRDEARMLYRVASYFENAEELRWTH